MALVNSTYLPIPLNDGQLLIGKSNFPPVVDTLSSYLQNPIDIFNGPGFIRFSYLQDWGTAFSGNYLEANNGYFSSGSPTFYWFVGNINIGDTFSVVSIDSSGFSVTTDGTSNIFVSYNGTTGNTITTTDGYSSITFVCSANGNSPATRYFRVLSTGSGTFTVSTV